MAVFKLSPKHKPSAIITNCYAHIGLFTTDRDEQMSSLSRTGSGYSPSFFFKPIKYGVMGNTLASNTNTVNNTTIKHQAVASLGNGKLCNLPLFSLFSPCCLLDKKYLMLFSLHTHLFTHYVICCSVVCVFSILRRNQNKIAKKRKKTNHTHTHTHMFIQSQRNRN